MDLGLLGVSAVLGWRLAVFAERRAADPILPPRLFRDRTFVLTSIASHCSASRCSR